MSTPREKLVRNVKKNEIKIGERDQDIPIDLLNRMDTFIFDFDSTLFDTQHIDQFRTGEYKREKWKRIFEEENLSECKPYSEVVELLKSLKKFKKNVVIVTNSSKNVCDAIVNHYKDTHDSDTSFEDVQIFGKDGEKKSLPAKIQEAIQELNSSSEKTVYIGNKRGSILAGKGVGCQTIGAFWDNNTCKEALKISDIDFFANSPKEVLNPEQVISIYRPLKQTISIFEEEAVNEVANNSLTYRTCLYLLHYFPKPSSCKNTKAFYTQYQATQRILNFKRTEFNGKSGNFLKDRQEENYKLFKNIISLLLIKDMSKFVIAAVPSSNPKNKNHQISRLVDDLNQEKKTGCEERVLIRTKQIKPLKAGGNRSVENHCRTLGVETSKIDVKNKAVILLDDVVTSGGSMIAARGKLLMAGALFVCCLAIGKTEKKHTETNEEKEASTSLLNTFVEAKGSGFFKSGKSFKRELFELNKKNQKNYNLYPGLKN